jgi:hypothetical protein
MPTSPDPLGKRALFLAPADRDAPNPLDAKQPAPGKRALFSSPEPLPGPIALDCSSCGAHSQVSYLEFVRLHLPLWLWIPGRRFSRLMNCPACERRTWMRVSFLRAPTGRI